MIIRRLGDNTNTLVIDGLLIKSGEEYHSKECTIKNASGDLWVSWHDKERKYKWMGTPGTRRFDYDIASGRFKGREKLEFTIPGEIESPF